MRIALLTAAALLVAGSIALLVNALTYEHTIYRTPEDLTSAMLSKFHVTRSEAEAYVRAHPDSVFNSNPEKSVRPGMPSVNEVFRQVQRDARADAVRRSRLLTAVALGLLAIVTGIVGWVIAGRVLRPVRLITKRARSASADDLDARVALEGPDDEMKVLADTFDSMLDRLQRSFAAQRRFSAQVSHELRTPLAVVRGETELLAGSELDLEARRSVESIRSATERAERIVTRLLELARSTSGDVAREPIALDALVGDVIGELVEADHWRRLEVDLELAPASIRGDVTLIDSLVRNLAENAARHNRPDGWVRITVRESDGCALLVVANSTVETGAPERGVGLSLASAIADAHGAHLDQSVTEPGTLVTSLSFPSPSTDDEPHRRGESMAAASTRVAADA
jgi:signal transduction histidine kinase